jgi:hypothetical protein
VSRAADAAARVVVLPVKSTDPERLPVVGDVQIERLPRLAEHIEVRHDWAMKQVYGRTASRSGEIRGGPLAIKRLQTLAPVLWLRPSGSLWRGVRIPTRAGERVDPKGDSDEAWRQVASRHRREGPCAPGPGYKRKDQ